MLRAPLRDVRQADTMSGGDPTKHTPSKATKLTPDKTIDKAAMAVAAKLIDSARKSQSKKGSKRMKLSLKKSGDANKKSSARALALTLSTESELNDTIEFQDTKPMKTSSRQQPVSRKRKAVEYTERGQRLKNLRQRHEKLETDNGNQPTSIQGQHLQERAADKKILTAKMLNAGSTSAPFASVRRNNCAGPENIVPAPRLNTDDSNVSSSSVRPSDSEDDKASQSESQSEVDLSLSQHTCPTCGEVVHGKFVRHIQKCLKEQFGSDWTKPPASEDTDQISVDSRADKTKQVMSTAGMASERKMEQADYFFCQLCQKDLTHLNSHRRTLHINHCMDQEQQKIKAEEARLQALEEAKTQVLDCPLCGLKLRTDLSRKTHLKKCASNLGVSPEQLLEAVKRQEEEHLVSLAAGILPDSYRPGRSCKANSTSTRRGLATQPRSKLDEDTQLALAISSSLQPGEVRETGPSTSGTTTAPTRRGRKNKQDADYLLLRLTEAQAAGRIETRVSQLITWQQESEDEENIPPLPRVRRNLLHGETTQNVCWSADEDNDHSKMFWRLTSLEECSNRTSDEDTDSTSMEFYVHALMPPVTVSHVAAGSKIRRMSEIPGRQGSQKPQPAAESEDTDDEADESMERDTPPPSTQTAALLADMAAEADAIDAMQLSSPSNQALVDDLEKQAHYELLSDFSSLVNQQEFSDVVIQAAGDTTLYAHRVILSVRCPSLLRLSDLSGVVDLSDWPADCVLAVLHFLYAGVTQLEQSVVQGTLLLAQRLGLIALEKVCRMRHSLPAIHLNSLHQDPNELHVSTSPGLMNTQTHIKEDDEMDSDIRIKSKPESLSFRDKGKTPGAGSFEKCKENMSLDTHPCETGQMPAPCVKKIQDGWSSSACTDKKQYSHASSVEIHDNTVRKGNRRKSSADNASSERVQSERLPQADSRGTHSENGFHGEQNIVHSDRNLQLGVKHEGNSPDAEKNKMTANEDQLISGKMGGFFSQEFEEELTQNIQIAGKMGSFFSQGFEEELTQNIQIVCQMVDKERRCSEEDTTGNSLLNKTSHDHSLPTHTSQHSEYVEQPFSEDQCGNNHAESSNPANITPDHSPAGNPIHTQEQGSSDDSLCLLNENLQLDDGNIHLQDGESTSSHNKAAVEDADTRETDSVSCDKVEEVKKVFDHGDQLVDSIEISDEDLFSDDGVEVYSLPSISSHHAECRDDGSRDSVMTPISESPAPQATQHERKEKSSDDGAESYIEKNNSLKTADKTLTKTDPRITLLPHSSGQRHPATTIDHSSSSFSVSALEQPSHGPTSLSSPHTGHFKTSTPQLSSTGVWQSGRSVNNLSVERNCNSSYGSLKDEAVISKTDAETQKRKLGQASRVQSVVELDSAQQAVTGLSVVNEDSLYVTPVVEHSKSRFVFQLVTPVMQQQVERAASPALASPPDLPLAAADAHFSTSYNNAGNRTEKTVSEGHAGGVDCSNAGHDSYQHGRLLVNIRRGSEDAFKEKFDNSDSDLEIVDTSLHDAPSSPKFTTLSSSQSQPRTAASKSPGSPHPDNQMDSSSPLMNSQQTRRQTSLSQTQQSDLSGIKQSKRITQSRSDTAESDTVNQTDPSSPMRSQAKRKRQASLSQTKQMGQSEGSTLKLSETRQNSCLKTRQSRQTETQEESLECWQQGSGPSPASATARMVQGSPRSSSPLSRFSQRSAESDREMAQAVDLVSPHHLMAAKEVDGRDPGSAGASPPVLQLSDGEMAECSCPADEDVWEGFSHLESYNPDLDLDLLGHNDLASDSEEQSGVHNQGQASWKECLEEGQASGPRSSSRPQLEAHRSPATAQSPQSLYDSPVRSPVSPARNPFRKSPRKCTRRTLAGQPKSRSHHQQLDEVLSPAEFTAQDGSDIDNAIDVNSSFLWSEENAPTDANTAVDEENILVLGREETVGEQDTQCQPIQTPRGPQRKKMGNKSTWIPLSPFTPMPSYDTMATPDLKNEIQKYGLKPLGKKRMKLILTDIYKKTHQYETDSDCDWDDPPTLEALTDQQSTSEQQPPVLHKHSDQQKPHPRAKAPPTKPPVLHKHLLQHQPKSRPPVLHREVFKHLKEKAARDEPSQPPLLHNECDKDGWSLDLDLPPVLHKETETNNRPKTKRGLAAKGVAEEAKTQITKKRQPKSKSVTGKGQNSDELPTLASVPSSITQNRDRGGPKQKVQGRFPANSAADGSSSPERDGVSSQDSDGSECPDVSVLEEQVVDSDDDDLTPSQQSAPDLQQKLMQFFKTHPELYHKVLTYEPLDMVVLKADLKAAGLRCSQEKLRNFLNAKCITFTTKNMLPGKQHRGRKPCSKKTKASQK